MKKVNLSVVKILNGMNKTNNKHIRGVLRRALTYVTISKRININYLCDYWKMVSLVLLEELRKPLEDLQKRIQEIGDSL